MNQIDLADLPPNPDTPPPQKGPSSINLVYVVAALVLVAYVLGLGPFDSDDDSDDEQSEDTPIGMFTSTVSSNGEYYVTVVTVSANQDLEAFSYALKDSTGTTNEFGEIAMQNLSGTPRGIDASYGFKCDGNDQPACIDDLTTRSNAVDSDDGSNYAVAFYDNDRDGRMSPGDKFTVRGNHGSEANGPAKDDWSLEVSFDNTGDVIGSKKLG